MQQIHRDPREPIIFKYEHLSDPDRAYVRQAAREIRKNVDTTIRSIWDIGQIDRKIVSGFLSVIAERNQAIVFPWLPKWQIVKIALDLQLQIYAADTELHRCERLLTQLGFDLQRIERIWR
jgi:hypothetical protein